MSFLFVSFVLLSFGAGVNLYLSCLGELNLLVKEAGQVSVDLVPVVL